MSFTCGVLIRIHVALHDNRSQAVDLAGLHLQHTLICICGVHTRMSQPVTRTLCHAQLFFMEYLCLGCSPSSCTVTIHFWQNVTVWAARLLSYLCVSWSNLWMQVEGGTHCISAAQHSWFEWSAVECSLDAVAPKHHIFLLYLNEIHPRRQLCCLVAAIWIGRQREIETGRWL